MGLSQSSNHTDQPSCLQQPDQTNIKTIKQVNVSVNNIIAYDSTLYGKSQILALIRNTRKVYEADLIKNNTPKQNIKTFGKEFAVKRAKKLYKIDCNDGVDHTNKLYEIYIELKMYRSKLEDKYEYIEDALSENLSIEPVKKEIRVTNKKILKTLANIKTDTISFDKRYRKKEKFRLLRAKLKLKNEEHKDLYEKQLIVYKQISKTISANGAEGYANQALKQYFNQEVGSGLIKNIDGYFDKNKITKGQFINQYTNSETYKIYMSIISHEKDISDLKDQLKK